MIVKTDKNTCWLAFLVLSCIVCASSLMADDEEMEETPPEYRSIVFSSNSSQEIFLKGCKDAPEPVISCLVGNSKDDIWVQANVSRLPGEEVEDTHYVISCIQGKMKGVKKEGNIINSPNLKPCRITFSYTRVQESESKATVIYDCVWDQDNRTIESADTKYFDGLNISVEEEACCDGRDYFSFKRRSEPAGEDGINPNTPKNYCVEVVTKSQPNMEIFISCSFDEKTYASHKACAGVNGNQEFIYRNYVYDLPVNVEMSIEICLQNKSHPESISAGYSIEVRQVQPVIFVHDLGDGPDGYDRPQSEWAYQLREEMPYICSFNPNQVYEFSWIESQKNSLSLYAGKGERQLSGYVKKITESYSKKPVLIAQGVGGLIVVEQLQKDKKFFDQLKNVFFCGTPFFGTEIGTVMNCAENIASKSSLKEPDELPELLCIDSVKDAYLGYKRISRGLLKETSRGNEYSWARRKKYSKLPLNDSKVTFIYAKMTTSFAEKAVSKARKATSKNCKKMLEYTKKSLEITAKTVDIGIIGVPFRWSLDALSKQDEESREYLAQVVASQLYLAGDGVVSIASANIAGFYGWNKAKSILLDDREFFHDKMLWIFEEGTFSESTKIIAQNLMMAVNE